MNIASVIVDVPAKQTDKSFDYLIPEQWMGMIEPGMRVIVPFGSRNIQGFVRELKDSSSFEKLREIIEPMDLTPVLNGEMLNIGDWLTEEVLCTKIAAYQAMIPAALKAQYEKNIMLTPGTRVEDLAFDLQPFLVNSQVLAWKDALKAGVISTVKKELAKGTVEVLYEVKERMKKKRLMHVFPGLPKEQLLREKDGLTRARKQQEVLAYFIDHPEPIELRQLQTNLGVNAGTIKGLVEKGILIQQEKEVYRDPYAEREFPKTEPLPLTDQQVQAITPVLSSIKNDRHDVFLLYGVTGSGKTEIYLQSIQQVIEKGKEAIVLVPEIALTPQMVHRFKGRFGDLVAVLHSGLSIGEKYDEWRKIQRKEVKVVVGARSAIYAPFENLGIIIIDEEHETSYKQEENPRYHARDVAIHRGILYQCPVILGSATPSLETFARAQKGVYQQLTLSKRMNDQGLPTVNIVDMREELREGNRSMFSRDLFEKLQDRIQKKQQTVLFLNKRGHSSFVMCRDCGYVILCPHCDISLTYHQVQNNMKCHYCGFESGVPNICPECQSDHIRYFGTGTQKVEEELGKLLPEAKVIRMDVDTTSRKGSHEKLLTEFHQGKADILLGTQMIAKGLDFPNITLVGVLSADTMLHLPDFRSSEKTFQLLTQVSGRAGRHQLPGEVVIQTYTPEHYSIELAGDQDFDRFYAKEMMMRKIHRYPPFYYLALVTVSHEELMKVVSITEKITRYLRSKLKNDAVILGPVASPIPRIKDRYRYQCLVKYKREPELGNALKYISNQLMKESSKSGLQIAIDMNPYILM
ncbi:primosomal protein N' [Bacillus sp. 1NLA3E]|uniref:primosomal protein N' n=1 Tax=Bacillus sp. 1NLA3E TaxID=666686 RepID=UPI000247E58E|nr:primosomal protein N' [Bacillus sp. 1NLA3E]AGK53027.1 primosome assembly protein PriA [Bacillus sp. 1NLA3E]